MGKPVRIASYFLAAFCVWIATAWLLVSFLVVNVPLDHADAILILAGSHEYQERCDKAAELFEHGVANKIVLTNDGEQSGWDQETRSNPLFVERELRRLTERGVPAGSIEILPGVAAGTIDESKFFAQFAAERDLRTVLLVTSAYHTRRARRVFQRSVPGAVVGIESPPDPTFTDDRFQWWLTPKNLETAGVEYAKLVYYWWEY